MTSGDVNCIMAFLLLMIVLGVFITRESTQVLDQLADWAQSRSWGLKCAKAEHDKRVAERSKRNESGATVEVYEA